MSNPAVRILAAVALVAAGSLGTCIARHTATLGTANRLLGDSLRVRTGALGAARDTIAAQGRELSALERSLADALRGLDDERAAHDATRVALADAAGVLARARDSLDLETARADRAERHVEDLARALVDCEGTRDSLGDETVRLRADSTRLEAEKRDVAADLFAASAALRSVRKQRTGFLLGTIGGAIATAACIVHDATEEPGFRFDKDKR